MGLGLMGNEKIPTATIGVLGQILPDWYSHSEIDSLFLISGAPGDVPDGSKPAKVQAWLRMINVVHPQPLGVLGAILDDFMEKQIVSNDAWLSSGIDRQAQLEAAQAKVRDTLARDGFQFLRGGTVTKGGAVPTLSLDESVRRQGLASVEIEIQRAMSMIERDPHAAAQYAGNVLEATLKAYLDHKKVTYKNSDTLADLWKLAATKMGLRAEDWDNKDLKKIASGLHSIVDGISHLRNTKSGAHGRSEQQWQSINLRPRHARLAIHSAHTVAAYVLELME